MERFMYLTKHDYDNWVNQSYKNFSDSNFRNVHMGNQIHLISYKNGKIFSSKCNPKDEYSILRGIAVAYARAKNNRIGVLVRHANMSDIEVGNTIIVKKTGKTEKRVIDEDFKKACFNNPSLMSLNYFVEV